MADSSRAAEPTLQPTNAAFEQLCGPIEGNAALLKIARELHQAYTGTMQEVLDYTTRSMEQLRMQQTETRAQVDELKDEVHQQHQAHLSAMGKLQKSIDNNKNATKQLEQKERATQAQIDELKDEQDRQELVTRKNRALARRSAELKHASHSGFLIFIIQIAITITQIVALCYLFKYMRLLPKTSDTSDRAAKISTFADLAHPQVHPSPLRKTRSLSDEQEDEFSFENEQRLERLNSTRAIHRSKKDSTDAEEENF